MNKALVQYRLDLAVNSLAQMQVNVDPILSIFETIAAFCSAFESGIISEEQFNVYADRVTELLDSWKESDVNDEGRDSAPEDRKVGEGTGSLGARLLL